MTTNGTDTGVADMIPPHYSVVVGAGSAGASLILELCQSEMRADIKGVVHIDHEEAESATLRTNLESIGFDVDTGFRSVHLQHIEARRSSFDLISEELNVKCRFDDDLNSNAPGIRVFTQLHEKEIIATITEMLPKDGAGELKEARVVYVLAVTGITSSTVALEAGELVKKYLNREFEDDPLGAGATVPNIGVAFMSPTPTMGAIQDNLPHGRKVCEVMSSKLVDGNLPFDKLLMVDGSGLRDIEEDSFTTWAGDIISSLLHARSFDPASETVEVIADTRELLNSLPPYANVAFVRTGWTDDQVSILRFLDKLDGNISELADNLDRFTADAGDNTLEAIAHSIRNYDWEADFPLDIENLESSSSFRDVMDEISEAAVHLDESWNSYRYARDELYGLNLFQKIFVKGKYQTAYDNALKNVIAAKGNLSEKREALRECKDRIVRELEVFWESLRRRMQVVPGVGSGLDSIRKSDNPLLEFTGDNEMPADLINHQENTLVRVVNPRPGNGMIAFERATVVHTGPAQLVMSSLGFPEQTYQDTFLEGEDRNDTNKITVFPADAKSASVDSLIFWTPRPREGFRVFARHYLESEIGLPPVHKDAWPDNSKKKRTTDSLLESPLPT